MFLRSSETLGMLRNSILLFLLCCATASHASPAPNAPCGHCGGTDTVSAMVVYGEETLLGNGEYLDHAALDLMIDSLLALDPVPGELVRNLRLLQRIRHMEQKEVVLLIDSLFDQDLVPYALVNEINLLATRLQDKQEDVHGLMVDWYGDAPWPAHEHYGCWETSTPNAYGPELSRHDPPMLIQLTDSLAQCGFSMPVGGVITSRFGWRDGRPHNGVDIQLRTGDPVQSMFPGVVRFAGYFGSYGRIVVVRHYNGLETFYAHLHKTKVRTGDAVDAGEVIGLGGSTGRSTGPHLHFEVRFKGIPIDPARFIDLDGGELTCGTLVLKRTRWTYAAYPLGTRTHKVEKGEHLYAIAERYGTSIQQLCELNGISKRSALKVGQELLVSAE